jgi:non-heme chloroperoxidase
MGNTVKISDELELYYEDQGSGDPVIFIPGWTCTTDFFQHNLNVVAQNYRVISYDPRSQGKSSNTTVGNNFAQRGKDLAAFISALELENVIIAGWSLGAYDAYAYFAEYGTANVRAFINIDMPPKGLKMHDDDWAEAPLTEMHGMFSAILQPDHRVLMQNYAQYMIVREASKEEIEWVVCQSMQTPSIVAALLAADAALSDYSKTVCELADALPVLHVIREDWAPVAIKWLEKNTPNARKEIMGGHMMFWEDPDSFNGKFLEFVNSL